MSKQREKIPLTSEQLRDIVYENYFLNKDEEIKVKEVENEYIDSGRHQEFHTKVFQRISDGKYFRVNYSYSVKDSMGWDECNYGPFEAIEVFPKIINKITYK